MTIFGLDFSHYDAVPAGARVVSEGFSFMTHKAGGDASDAEFAAWWSALKPQRGKVLLGAYWVLYPGNPTGRADAFIARLDATAPGWRDGPFILQLDCEKWNGDASTKPGRSDIKAACDRLVARVPKLRPIVYASAGQYGDSLNGLGYPLWNARYPTSSAGTASGLYAKVGGDAGKGWGKYSGAVPAIWQFSSSANALGQSTCDVNAYRGTLEQLTALVAPGWKATDVDINEKIGDKAYTSRTVGDVFRDVAKLRGVLFGSAADTKNAGYAATSPLMKLIGVPGQVTALMSTVQAIGKQLGVSTDALKAAIDDVDNQVVAQLTDANRTNDETAQLLVSLFGDRAGDIARAVLAAQSETAS